MAHYDIFREQLAITYPAFGHALWEPGPDGVHGRVTIGDVGYMRQGKFHRLFNALLSADHPSHHETPLPEHHEPLIPNVSDHIDRGILKPDHYCSAGVTVEIEREDIHATMPADFPQVSFLCTRRRGGAVLSIPVDAQRQDTRARGDFGKWMIRHIDSWFAFARGLGLGIEHMEEIVLVTGQHLTRSWANVAFFEGQASGQASLGVRVVQGPEVSINWHCLPGSVRGGVRSWGPEGRNLPEDQCVLLRGFRVTRILGILPKRLRGAAGPHPSPDPGHDDYEPVKELTWTGSDTMGPLHVLLEYVAEQAHDCDMVLAHDDDLAWIHGVDQADALMDHLENSKPEIERFECDCSPSNGGISTKGTFKVAMLSNRSQEPSLARQDILVAAHDQAIGVGRPGYGKEGRQIKLFSNHVEVKLGHGMIYHYDVISPFGKKRGSEMRSIAQNLKVIDALQTQVEGRLSVQPGVYDGRKNLLTSFDLGFESGAREYIVPLGHPSDRGVQSTEEFTVRLTYVASINPEVLQRFVKGEQRHDNEGLTAIMALNIVIRTEPSLRYPSKGRSFFTDQDTRPIGGGIHLWRGYFQSVRPSINRMLINVDISTGVMYRPGRLMDLALESLGLSGRPNALAPRLGFPDRERLRLQHFITGLKVTTPYRSRERDRKRLIKKVTREGARDRTFEIGDGQIMTVAEYFQDQLNIPLQFPDMVCVELSTKAVIPLELCEVPQGQIVRKQMSPDQVNSILGFSTMRPPERMKSIVKGLNVLQYGQSEYVRQFGMSISDKLVNVDARIIEPPRLKYHPESRQANVQPREGTWNMIDKRMYQPAGFPNWMVIIYERQPRFNSNAADGMIKGFVNGCEAVGIAANPKPAVVRWESGQGIISQQLRAACEECQRKAGAPPSLIVVVIPEGGNDIYTAVKHFGDVTAGIPTQCMKAAKCFRAKPQYYANITLKVNMKLGGTNVVPEPKDISFLTDPANPTMVMGGDITHPPPGTRGRPSFSAIIGSVDAHATRYVSRLGVQATHRELIDGIEDMCVSVFEEYRKANNQLPKRILFYRDGVSEAEFRVIIDEELHRIRRACERVGFNPKITFIVVGKYHKVVFFPTTDMDRSGNCPAGTVVDRDVISPVEFDYYLYGHAGILGTSRPAHYNILVDENNFTPDGLQSLSFALCHVYARCTRSVSVPAPVYYAHNVCMRAKNHYDPQVGPNLFESDIASATTDSVEPGNVGEGEFQLGFRQAHERMANTMYFC